MGRVGECLDLESVKRDQLAEPQLFAPRRSDEQRVVEQEQVDLGVLDPGGAGRDQRHRVGGQRPLMDQLAGGGHQVERRVEELGESRDLLLLIVLALVLVDLDGDLLEVVARAHQHGVVGVGGRRVLDELRQQQLDAGQARHRSQQQGGEQLIAALGVGFEDEQKPLKVLALLRLFQGGHGILEVLNERDVNQQRWDVLQKNRAQQALQRVPGAWGECLLQVLEQRMMDSDEVLDVAEHAGDQLRRTDGGLLGLEVLIIEIFKPSMTIVLKEAKDGQIVGFVCQNLFTDLRSFLALPQFLSVFLSGKMSSINRLNQNHALAKLNNMFPIMDLFTNTCK